MKRKIIQIDENLCNGCGNCIPNCHEGALQLIDGRARLISDLFCDGLGACVGECPLGAMKVVEREAEPYDERKTMLEQIIPAGANTIKAHLKHLRDHGESALVKQAEQALTDSGLNVADYADMPEKLPCGCPGTLAKMLKNPSRPSSAPSGEAAPSELNQWPVQLALLNPQAGYFDDVDLLICADCVPFAFADFHRELLRGKIVIIFCPKLDSDIERYISKLAEIFTLHKINSLTLARMEVPCCGGVEMIVNEAKARAGVDIPTEVKIIAIEGGIKK